MHNDDTNNLNLQSPYKHSTLQGNPKVITSTKPTLLVPGIDLVLLNLQNHVK